MDEARMIIFAGLPASGIEDAFAYLDTHRRCLQAAGVFVGDIDVSSTASVPQLLDLATRSVGAPTAIVGIDTCDAVVIRDVVMEAVNRGIREVRAITTLRPPVEWIRSAWMQHLRLAGEKNWVEYVLEQLSARPLAPVLQTLSNASSSGLFEVVASQAGPVQLAHNLLLRAGIAPCTCSATTGHADNAREVASELEHLYYPLLAHWVRYWVRALGRDPGPLPTKDLEAYLRSIYRCRPCFEIAQLHEDQFSIDRLGLYDQQANAALGEFAESWAKTVESALRGDLGFIDAATVSVLADHLVECEGERRTLDAQHPGSPSFPVPHWAALLPLDSRFIGQARSIAQGFLLATR